MVQITIDIPDELAMRLAPFQNQLSELLTRLIAISLPEQLDSNLSLLNLTPPSTYQEILDFLISRPTSEEIINFKVSNPSQTRLQTLLQKNRDGILTATEKSELDLYQQLDTLMGLLKVRAYVALNSKTES
ncbi:MAG: hypothetical protein VKK42_20915 [Lyngbya sp.]|nr:hypothetical protein [Lyngbya sp.]